MRGFGCFEVNMLLNGSISPCCQNKTPRGKDLPKPKSHYKSFFTNELFGFQLTRPRYCVTFLSQNVFNPIDTWWTETSKICEELINEYLTYFKMKIFQELSWVHVKFGFFVSGQKCGFGVIMARRPLRHFAAFEGHCPLRNNHPKSNPWKIPELMNFFGKFRRAKRQISISAEDSLVFNR